LATRVMEFGRTGIGPVVKIERISRGLRSAADTTIATSSAEEPLERAGVRSDDLLMLVKSKTGILRFAVASRLAERLEAAEEAIAALKLRLQHAEQRALDADQRVSVLEDLVLNRPIQRVGLKFGDGILPKQKEQLRDALQEAVRRAELDHAK